MRRVGNRAAVFLVGFVLLASPRGAGAPIRSDGSTPAERAIVVRCVHPKAIVVDVGVSLRLVSIEAEGSAATIALEATRENFMQPNGPQFSGDPYYIAIDRGKPSFGTLVGGVSRHIVHRFTHLTTGKHEIVYGVGMPAENWAWNVCIET